MSKITWDEVGERLYETGVSCGVLYPFENNAYSKGVAWNGLTTVSESPSGAEPNALYADNIKYLNLISAEEFGCTIEAYTYPDEFAECDGSISVIPGVSVGQQERKAFGFSYKTIIGNDVDNNNYSEKLHLVYGCKAAPSGRDYNTVNDSPEAATMSWEVSTTPIKFRFNGKDMNTATLTIDKSKVDAAKYTQLENILYGTDSTEPTLPMPEEVAAIFGVSLVYGVSYTLVNVTSSNTAKLAKTTEEFETELTADSGYEIESVVVLSGGVDITDSAVSDNTIAIGTSYITGPIAIIATANKTSV